MSMCMPCEKRNVVLEELRNVNLKESKALQRDDIQIYRVTRVVANLGKADLDFDAKLPIHSLMERTHRKKFRKQF